MPACRDVMKKNTCGQHMQPAPPMVESPQHVREGLRPLKARLDALLGAVGARSELYDGGVDMGKRAGLVTVEA